MTRLPTPGKDSGQWGNILNDFLGVAHNADGTLKLITDTQVSASSKDGTASTPSMRTLGTGSLQSAAGDHTHSLNDPEKAYWADQAALLDPLAYEFVVGNSWSRTVPTGETWYAINMYQVNFGNSTKAGFLRPLDVRRPVQLTAGTTFTNFSSQSAYAYLCKPQLVFTADSRYTSDPKGLYFTRLDRLRQLAVNEIVGTITNASPNGTTVEVAFPTDFSYGLLTAASTYDASWSGLGNYDNSNVLLANLNNLNEINNDHAIRFAESIMAPFSRTIFPKLTVRGGNKAGDTTTVTLNGFGQMLYHKLPSDW